MTLRLPSTSPPGPIPFGLGQQKPNNFLEVFWAGWDNLDNLGYAWRILRDGVCDGCALGTQARSFHINLR